MNTTNLNREKTPNEDIPASTEDLLTEDDSLTDQASPNHGSIHGSNHASGDQAEHSAPMALYGEKASLTSLFKDCLKNLFQKPPRLTALILAVALTIPAAIAIMSTGFFSAEQNLLDSRHVTVFLSKKSSSEASQLAKTLADNKHIIAAELRRVDLQNREVMALDVHPAATLDKTKLSFIVDELNSHTLVDYVAADLAWLERNVEAIETARILRMMSIAVAALITAIIVFLLTRSDLPRQNSELNTLHQMGASRKMLQKPLMLRSVLLTLLAGIIGTLLAWGAIANLPNLVEMSTYEHILPRSFPATNMISLIILALLCSALTVRLFVKIR